MVKEAPREIGIIGKKGNTTSTLQSAIARRGHHAYIYPNIQTLREAQPQPEVIIVHENVGVPEGYQNTPRILLGRGNTHQAAHEIDKGATDYISTYNPEDPHNPFPFYEVAQYTAAKIDRMSKNGRFQRIPAENETITYPGIRLETERGKLFINDVPAHLTRSETELLAAMMSAPGKLFTFQALLDQTDKPNTDASRQVLKVRISNLRKALSDYTGDIVTERGRGYKFVMGKKRKDIPTS